MLSPGIKAIPEDPPLQLGPLGRKDDGQGREIRRAGEIQAYITILIQQLIPGPAADRLIEKVKGEPGRELSRDPLIQP